MKNKVDKNDLEKGGYKLLKLLVENPHISHADLQKINCPVLVIGGDHDVIKAEHTMEIFNNIPKSFLWILPNSGHSTPIVYDKEFNTKVDAFLRQPFRNFSAVARFF